jgi:F-type H+-transporting ATPase subunit b
MRDHGYSQAAPAPQPARRPVTRVCFALLMCAAIICLSPPHASAREAAHQPPAHGESASGAQPGERGAEHAEGGEHGILSVVAKVFNFAILAGVLVYFLKTPIAGYLASRGTQIRQDLVSASDMRAAATAQLAEIERQLEALPAELDALRVRGAEDVKAERARIEQAAGAERERLLAQTRREIEMRLRIARRELIEHAAQLAVGIAEARIVRSITPDDQLRMVDRYAHQLREAR